MEEGGRYFLGPEKGPGEGGPGMDPETACRRGVQLHERRCFSPLKMGTLQVKVLCIAGISICLASCLLRLRLAL
jgi:hypothetical protein